MNAVKKKHRTHRIRNKNKKRPKTSLISRFLIIFGICFFVVAGLVFSFFNIPGTDDQNNPFILVACNVPNQYLHLYECIGEDGNVTLLPVWDRQDEVENVKFWVRIIDNYDFSWQCSGDMKAIELVDVLSDEGFVYETSEIAQEGTGVEVTFCIEYEHGRSSHYSDIKFRHIDKQDYFPVSGRIARMRIPWITHWINTDMNKYLDSHKKGFSTSENEFINTMIDGEWLYMPLIEYTASAPDMSLMNTDYELHNVSPDANSVGAYLIWRGSMFFMPTLQYEVTNTAIGDAKFNIYAIIIGVALSLIVEGIKRRAA